MSPHGETKEQDDRRHGQAGMPELVPLQGRHENGDGRDSEEETDDGTSQCMHRMISAKS
jgi:hypothetical protein